MIGSRHERITDGLAGTEFAFLVDRNEDEIYPGATPGRIVIKERLVADNQHRGIGDSVGGLGEAAAGELEGGATGDISHGMGVVDRDMGLNRRCEGACRKGHAQYERH